MQFGAIFSAVGTCKKVVDFVKDVQKVPEDAAFLWKLVDSLEPPVMLAAQLLAREATIPYVSSALDLIHDVLTACDVVLVRADPEGRPYEPDSWSEWWTQVPARTKDDLSRKELLPKLIARLSHASSALHLALLTAQMRALTMGPLACTGSHPLRVEDAVGAADAARRVLHLFEMGRLPGASPTYQLWAGKVEERGQTLSFNAAVLLRRKTSAAFELVVVEVDHVNEQRDAQQSSASSSSCGRLEKEFGTDINPPPRKKGAKKAAVPSNIQPLFVIQSSKLVDVGTSLEGDSITITIKASAAEVALDESTTVEGERSVETRSVLLKFDFKPCTAAGQFAYFPLGRETYTKITLERALWILCAIKMHGKGPASAAIDTVAPMFDVNKDAFAWLHSQLAKH